jgi:hypothetical protein
MGVLLSFDMHELLLRAELKPTLVQIAAEAEDAVSSASRSVDTGSAALRVRPGDWVVINSVRCIDDAGLHLSAISLLLTVYVTEGENTSVESPVALPVFVCSGRDPIEDFPVELPGWCSGILHTLHSSPVESIPEPVFPCHETDSQLVGNLFPTRRDWLLALPWSREAEGLGTRYLCTLKVG